MSTTGRPQPKRPAYTTVSREIFDIGTPPSALRGVQTFGVLASLILIGSGLFTWSRLDTIRALLSDSLESTNADSGAGNIAGDISDTVNIALIGAGVVGVLTIIGIAAALLLLRQGRRGAPVGLVAVAIVVSALSAAWWFSLDDATGPDETARMLPIGAAACAIVAAALCWTPPIRRWLAG